MRPLLVGLTLLAGAGALTASRAMPRTVAQSEVGPHRVISLVPAVTEMLFAMDAGSRVVGIGSYDHVPPEAGDLPRVGGLIDPHVERILSLHPDLVIAYETQHDLRQQLDRARIPIFRYQHRGLADVMQTIRLVGRRIGVEPSAETLARTIEGRLQAVRARVAGRPRPRTLLIFGREPGSLRRIEASGGRGFLHDMLETAGGDDVLGDVGRESVEVSTEMVLARAPDVIVELRYRQDASTAGRDISAWNILSSVPAVRDGRVHLLMGDQFVVPGPRVAEATEQFARTLHPESFQP